MAVDKNMAVLIVDDYKTMLRIIRNLLRQIGFNNVDEASDGATALQKLRRDTFGLVISDWNMEPMTGLQLLKEVRADEKLRGTPFIMVTAESKTENVIAAKKAGVNNYIEKPVSYTHLDAVERVSTAAESMAPEMAEGILVAVTEILEAASVRDIAGQRLTAVRDAVDHLSDTIHRPTEGGLERNRDKSAKIEEKHDHGSSSESGLLNGPQLPGAAKTQSEVDALFDKLD